MPHAPCHATSCHVLPLWQGELDGEICETIPLRGSGMVLGKSPEEGEQAIEIEVNTALGRSPGAAVHVGGSGGDQNLGDLKASIGVK